MKSPMRTYLASVIQDEANIQEKLNPDEARKDSCVAMSGEPPNTEEKENPEQRLVAVQDRQGGAAKNSEN